MKEQSAITEREDFLIVTNSPGELSSWVRSTSESLKNIKPCCRIIVVLVPCPYATGREKEIAMSFPQVDLVLSPGEFLKISMGLDKNTYTPSRKGIVIFMGGDFWHALWIARKLRYPAVAYTTKNSRWNRYFHSLFVKDEHTRQNLIMQGIQEDKIEIVGNLMTDGIKASTRKGDALEAWGLNPESLTVGLFPGSRLFHVQETIPIFLKVAEELSEHVPGVQFILNLSPFVQIGEIEECVKHSSYHGIQGSCGVLQPGGSTREIVTRAGVKIKLVENRQYDVINASDLILTIPGTNTAEIAVLGRPMVVIYTWRARVPRGGLGSLLNMIPVEWSLKRTLMHMAYKKPKYKALPNQWASREIVPEVILEEKPEEITQVALELLKDKERRERISEELRNMLREPGGAAERIAQKIAFFSEHSDQGACVRKKKMREALQ